MRLALNPWLFFAGPFMGRMPWARPEVARRVPVTENGRVKVHELARHVSFSIPWPQGCVVACTAGSVWITQDGDIKDVFLQRGESLCPDRNRRALIQALELSCVRVTRVV